MDALMAALVAALVVQPTDRLPWLTAILGERFRPASVLAGTVLALLVGYGIAAEVGALIGPRLTPEAKQLFLALALASAGISAFFRIKPPKRFEGSRLGGVVLSMIGALALSVGDRTQFIVVTLAARSPVPALAAVGALIGTLIVVVPATLAGERARRRIPFTAIHLVSGGLLTVTGIVVGLSAIGLI